MRRLRAEATDDYGPGFKHDYGWTIALNMFERGGQDFRLTRPINIGFTEPADVALASSRSTVSALICGVEVTPDPMDLVALETLKALSIRAIELFAEGQALVDERELRLQEREGNRAASSSGLRLRRPPRRRRLDLSFVL